MLKKVDITIPMPWGLISGRTYGEVKQVPVLCVHGRSDNLETFSNLIPLLPQDYYYVCIDLPGHGKSEHADKGYVLDLVWYTLCVKRVIEYFSWSKLYYIGHSLGGQIGYILSALYQDLVKKLIVIDALMHSYIPGNITATSLRDYVFDPILKLEKRSNLDEAPTYSLLEFIHKMIQSRSTKVSYEQIQEMAERNLLRIGPDQYKYSNDQRVKILGPIHFTIEQLQNIAGEIRCPTLVIMGKYSTATRPHKKLKISPLFNNKNVTFQVIEGDHDIHLVHPDQVANLISPFLSGGIISKL